MTNETQPVEPKVSDKELNFRKQEQYFQNILKEKQALLEQKEQELARLQQAREPEEEEDSDAYIDKRKLDKNLSKFGEKQRKEIQTDIQKAITEAVESDRQERWLKQNPDFYDVINKHAEDFAAQDQEFADTILKMPKGFEREKLVYKSIKAMGIDRPKASPASIQDEINRKQHGAYYRPTSASTAPYSAPGDFSLDGQKAAFDKIQKLLKR